MRKDGQVKIGGEDATHCSCGKEATTVVDGVPLCEDCKEDVEDDSAEKVASQQ